ncbi:MAG TPA: hypothetical protein VGH97_15485 [Thermoanaerobaculia bacterium]|jgi:hypothetical protein
MRRKTRLGAAGAALSALLLLGFTDYLPDRIAEYSRKVEQVRGRKFNRAVQASELDKAELRRVLRSKLGEQLPVPAEDYFRTLASLGLIEDQPGLLDTLIDFYASQVIAFYDPQPRRFFVIRGGDSGAEGFDGGEGMAQGLIFSHELTHALQDESLKLDDRMQKLKDDSDRALALQSLLEGEATLVMIRVALQQIPGSTDQTEEEIGPLLSAGALERANVPKEVPDYFVDQLFFPYVDGLEFVRAAVKRGGWPEVDRLWRTPPESSAEILHGGQLPPPATGLLPDNLASIAPGQRLLYFDTLGEWTLRFLLERALPEGEASASAAGWRGDRIAFFASGGTTGYLWRIRFDEPGSASRFEAAIRKARAKKPAAVTETIRVSGKDVVLSSGLAKLPELPGWKN